MDSRITPPIYIGTGSVSRPSDAAGSRSQTQQQADTLKQYYAPHKAQANYIPSPELLDNMINRAVEARDKGVYWDRGSILNLVL